MAASSWIAVCLLLACVASCASSADEHNNGGEEHHHEEEEHNHEHHGKTPWEWSGIFQVSKGHYSWTAERRDGAYADRSMQFLLLSAHGKASASGLKALAEKAERMWPNTTWTNRSSGQELTPGIAYNLQFDQHSWISVFPVDVEDAGTLAVFAQHFPTEFENNVHFFKTEEGADVEPVAVGGQLKSATPAPSSLESESDWAVTILGSFITCTPTLLGVFFASCALKPQLRELLTIWEPSLDSFASGVLFAAAVFLLLPEALHLASSGHDDEVVGAWTWGTSILLGWLTCTLIHHSCSIVFAKSDAKGEVVVDAKGEVDIEKNSKSALGTSSWMNIAGPVIFGDFFHNFADGFVLGAAFQNCSRSFAWRMVGVTFAHELPQEIADFFILINDAGMRWHWATLANFLCSLSTVLGAMITFNTKVGSNEQGYILAYGAGVYMFIAMTELGAKVAHLPQEAPDLKAVVKRLAPFAVGCAAIGLVLISHEHCAAPVAGGGTAADAGAHAGHNH